MKSYEKENSVRDGHTRMTIYVQFLTLSVWDTVRQETSNVLEFERKSKWRQLMCKKMDKNFREILTSDEKVSFYSTVRFESFKRVTLLRLFTTSIE